MQIARNILWIDCSAGALAGTLVLLFSATLSGLYALSETLLACIGVVNLLYASYSGTLALCSKRPAFLINTLVIANSCWALLCVGLVVQSAGHIAPLGIAHLIGEAIFVGGLAMLEWKWRQQLLTAH